MLVIVKYHGYVIDTDFYSIDMIKKLVASGYNVIRK